MYKKRVVFLLGTHALSWAMQPQFTTPIKKESSSDFFSPKTVTFGSSKYNESYPGMEYLAKAWQEIIKESYAFGTRPQQNSLFVCINIITSREIFGALQKAQHAGVDVKLLVSPQTFRYLRESGILKDLADVTRVFNPEKTDEKTLDDIHAKLLLYAIGDKKGYSLGSSNMTYYGLFQNSEVNQITLNDPDNYNVLHKDMMNIWNKSQKYTTYKEQQTQDSFSPIKMALQGLKETPQVKRTVFTSLGNNLVELMLDRLDAEKFTQGDAVWLSSFTYNNADITQALLDLLSKKVNVTLYLDKSPLENYESSKQLQKLFDAQARIYIFNGNRTIHHAKFMLIERGKGRNKKYISIVSTQNIKDPEKRQDFDALTLDTRKSVFDTMLKQAQGYENSDAFELLTLFPGQTKRKLVLKDASTKKQK